MLHVRNDSTNPYHNLALEEYLIRDLPAGDDCFMFWQNRPAIIVGRNQYTRDEINADFVNEHGVAVVRRMTGGGAVYHDLGNLNFSFIVNGREGAFLDFASFARPVVEALGRLGVRAEFGGRNDITISGLKISGNAQYLCKGRLLHHGTLLFDSDLDNLTQALNVSPDKIAGKGVPSVRSRVTNIREYLPAGVGLEEFRQALTDSVFAETGAPAAEYRLTEADRSFVDKLQGGKYEAWEWNYGEAPAFSVRRQQRFNWGKIDLRLNLEGELIRGCKIYGDFFGQEDVSALEQKLTNIPFREEQVRSILEGSDLSPYVHGLEPAGLLRLLFNPDQ